jgi:hypothetical protein
MIFLSTVSVFLRVTPLAMEDINTIGIEVSH